MYSNYSEVKLHITLEQVNFRLLKLLYNSEKCKNQSQFSDMQIILQ